jgi:carboxypeptidase Q
MLTKLLSDENQYFWYHHTNADTIDHIDMDDFNLCLGTFASVAYVIADMQQQLPRKSV